MIDPTGLTSSERKLRLAKLRGRLRRIRREQREVEKAVRRHDRLERQRGETMLEIMRLENT